MFWLGISSIFFYIKNPLPLSVAAEVLCTSKLKLSELPHLISLFDTLKTSAMLMLSLILAPPPPFSTRVIVVQY